MQDCGSACRVLTLDDIKDVSINELIDRGYRFTIDRSIPTDNDKESEEYDV